MPEWNENDSKQKLPNPEGMGIKRKKDTLLCIGMWDIYLIYITIMTIYYCGEKVEARSKHVIFFLNNATYNDKP